MVGGVATQICIRLQDDEEVLFAYGRNDTGEFIRVRLAPEGVPARNPAFDVTPAELTAGIITEKGIIKPYREEIAKVAS